MVVAICIIKLSLCSLQCSLLPFTHEKNTGTNTDFIETFAGYIISHYPCIGLLLFAHILTSILKLQTSALKGLNIWDTRIQV